MVRLVPQRYKSIPPREGAINGRKMAVQTCIQFSVVSLVPLKGSRMPPRYNERVCVVTLANSAEGKRSSGARRGEAVCRMSRYAMISLTRISSSAFV